MLYFFAFKENQAMNFVLPPEQGILEEYLLASRIIDREQLDVAKRMQLRQEAPLLMVLYQLSFINIKQFSQILDWLFQTSL
jgi:aromatic ring-cleaving dioxygenase